MTPETNIQAVIESLYRIGGGKDAPKTYGRFALVSDTAAAAVVLRNSEIFWKDYGVMGLLGRSRFNTDGEAWDKRRTLTQPHYTAAARPGSPANVVETFERTFDELDRQSLSDGSDLGSALARSALLATTRVFFNALEAEQDVTTLVDGFDRLRQLMMVMQTASFCDPVRIDVSALEREAADLRAWIRRYAERQPALLELLGRLTDGAANDPVDAAEELVGNFFAGIETSAVTLSWAMAMLGGDPEVQEELRAEAVGDGDRSGIETFLNETLRVFPPVPLVTRIAKEDFDSPDLSVRRGANVLVSVVGVHHDPDAWEEPNRFDPRRRQFRDRSYNRRAFIPFLYGTRVCGGAALARIEITEGLVALLRRYRFTRTDKPLGFQYAAALRPILNGRLLAHRL